LEELLGYIDVQGGDLTYSNLFDRVKTLARVTVDPQGNIGAPKKAGIRCLIALLARAKFVSSALVDQPDPGRAAKVIGKRPPSQLRENRIVVKAPDRQIITDQEASPDPRTPLLNLNILVEAKDPESIKQVIELIRYIRSKQDN
jgi:hypothetical protein